MTLAHVEEAIAAAIQKIADGQVQPVPPLGGE
jgi:hypothetical protein